MTRTLQGSPVTVVRSVRLKDSHYAGSWYVFVRSHHSGETARMPRSRTRVEP